jgi:membrane-bound serine protease (ClpP class)
MFFVWALALSGLFLIYLEFLLPGAIMAIGGTVLLVASVIMFYMAKPGFLYLTLYLLALGGAVFTIVRFSKWCARLRTKQESILHDQVRTTLFPSDVIGKMAKAATDLNPNGQIFVGDQTFQALSQTGFIDKGSNVVIVRGQGPHLIVEAVKE